MIRQNTAQSTNFQLASYFSVKKLFTKSLSFFVTKICKYASCLIENKQ